MRGKGVRQKRTNQLQPRGLNASFVSSLLGKYGLHCARKWAQQARKKRACLTGPPVSVCKPYLQGGCAQAVLVVVASIVVRAAHLVHRARGAQDYSLIGCYKRARGANPPIDCLTGIARGNVYRAPI